MARKNDGACANPKQIRTDVDCRAALTFPFKQLLDRDGPCGNLKSLAFARAVTCAPIAGYICTARVDIHEIAFHARCVDEQTRSVGLAIWYEAPSPFG